MEAITYRPLEGHEQPQALSLWQTVFTETPGYFDRYFFPEYGYRERDSLGAWTGGRLVSTVHLCRRLLRWGDTRLLCGGIANVATLPEFRRLGLSRRLLVLAIEKMEREGFHFSLLGTSVPSHYAALGWEQTHAPRVVLELKPDPAPLPAEWQEVDTAEALVRLYAASPRPLQLDRSLAYFEGWAGWSLRRISSRLHHIPGHGYLALIIPQDSDQLIFATEWRAADAATEGTLLRAASAEALRQGRGRLGLEALPQHLDPAHWETLGAPTVQSDMGSMARNISLGQDQYQDLLDAYRSGSAVWWMADGF